MTTRTINYPDNLFTGGVCLVLISLLIYCIPALTGINSDNTMGVFMFNYFAALLFYGCMFFTKKHKGTENKHIYALFLALTLISAYSLNRTITVFEKPVGWFAAAQVMAAFVYLLIPFIDKAPIVLRRVSGFAFGISFALFVYLSVYLTKLYPLSFIAAIALGLSLHTFVPLLFVIFAIRWCIRTYPTDKWQVGAFLSGIVFSLLFLTGFTLTWQRINRIVGHQYQHGLLADNNDLPSWISTAQRLPANSITEKYLKSNLVYTQVAKDIEFFDFGFRGRNFDEPRKHDPLVLVASLFTPVQEISEDERIKMLEYGFDARHKTQDRLWSGKDLSTTHVISNIRLWPQYRMAYTEKTITVSNDNQRSWGRDEEAIYTFHLPEGGVVTSLSLWINGQEEKAILTTKGKADTAYRQIVGVERHDPSVVHWQEGNTVSVRVFPVSHQDKRTFKIGITAPLTAQKNKLIYNHIYFDGPDAGKAGEIVQVDWEGKADAAAMKGFEPKSTSRFIRERDYDPDWSMEMPDPGISPNAFNFNGKSYHVAAYQPQRKPVNIQKAYLDINASWTEDEFDDVLGALKTTDAYAWDDGLVKLTADNCSDIFNRLQRNHFSLFPFYEIKDPATALFISKSNLNSPNTADLKGTEFAKKLELWLQKEERLCFFNLNNTLSPYLKSLKEHRSFNYEQGDTQLLKDLLSRHQFANNIENDQLVVIDNAGITLSQDNAATTGNAPDHFMRLFAYNHMMQQLKRGIYTNLEADTSLIKEAQQAYVVTPLSSLIVLETQADYDRFGIKDANNSLKNASMKSSGAVPEPHEWALIIIAFATMVWLRFGNRFKSLFIKA